MAKAQPSRVWERTSEDQMIPKETLAKEIASILKERGLTILLVEQNLQFASGIADRHYVVEQGQVVDEVPNHALAANMNRLNAYLGV